MDAGYAKTEHGELGELVFHQCDERRDDQRGSAESDGRKLVAKRLPCPGGHHEQKIATVDCGAANGFLVGAKALEAEDRVQEASEVVRIGRSGQNAADPS